MRGNELLAGYFGLEKESLRVDKLGQLSPKKHPIVFAENHPYVIKDFSEAQIEMVTPPLKTIEDAYNFLTNIQQIVFETLDEEYLWPQSNPPILPSEAEIPVASYKKDIDKNNYRSYLSQKYNLKKSIISGIHFNLSFDDEVLTNLLASKTEGRNFTTDVNELYLKIAMYFMKYRWLFIYVLGASPIFHDTFVEACVKESQKNGAGDCFVSGMKSLRNSVCGYRNMKEYFLDYSSYQKYQESILGLVQTNELAFESELYTAVRIKKDGKENAAYLELRFIDSNPLFSNGVAQHDLEFLHLCFVYFANQPKTSFYIDQQANATMNQDMVSKVNSGHKIINDMGKEVPLENEANVFLDKLEHFCQQKDFTLYDYKIIITTIRERITDSNKSYANLIIKEVDKANYIDFHLKQAKQFKASSGAHHFKLAGLDGLELSTQLVIKAAMKRGLLVEVLDQKENFIKVIDPLTQQTEYIKEATKTSADIYSQVLIMENKAITKQLLTEHNIEVPEGFIITKKAEALSLFQRGKLAKQLVIKPNTTNFGKGITIFIDAYTQAAFEAAIDIAFAEDETIILERYLSGPEYRFLVIGEEVVGVLHRRAASVLGTGEKTIKQLVDEKNKNHLRGTNYKSPLEKIKIGYAEKQFLQQNGYTFESIPLKNQRVFLRENSNISTGGDSIDYTDLIDSSYSDIAIAAAKALKVHITGVDMIISNYQGKATTSNYGIIELNFNPALHIHAYPYKGKNRHGGEKVIDYLFKKRK